MDLELKVDLQNEGTTNWKTKKDQKTKKVRNMRRGIGERGKRKFGFIENNMLGSI